MLEGAARQVLEGDERLPVLLANVVDRADAGMVQSRRGPGLALEAFERLRICGHRVREELEGHGAPQARVLGFVDDTHPAAAKLAQDAVVGEGLSDHQVMPVRSAGWAS